MNQMQREALRVLAEIWDLAPEVRLGQLMAHLGFLGEVHVGKGLGYIEDDELLAVLYRHQAELRARLEGAAQPSGSAANRGCHFGFRESHIAGGGPCDRALATEKLFGEKRLYGSAMATQQFQCCFCGGSLLEEDPCLVHLLLLSAEEATQELWGHAACLRRVVHPAVPLLLPEECEEPEE